MRGFPVVVGLVAVLDGCEQGSDQVGGQKDVKSLDGFNSKCAWSSETRGLLSVKNFRKIPEFQTIQLTN